MTKARALLSGASWLYGAQLTTVIAQLGYAAITSRIVSPDGFGAYAVALTVSALIGLVANGGLGQAVSRMLTLDIHSLRALMTFGLLMGGAGAAVLYVTADFWAWVWATPSAATPIRWLCISTFVGPILGLAAGLIRRTSRFRALALATVACNVIGMIVGSVAVVALQTSSSLLISPILAQCLLTIVLLILMREYLLGFARLRAGREHIAFSGKLIIASVASYVVGNVATWTTARFFGASFLGQWNRADTLTTVPFYQVQSAMVQVVYPEFRHDIDSSTRARVVWPDLLTLAAWGSLPPAALVAVVAPTLVPLVFGPGWELAAQLVTPLALIAGIRVVVVLLGSAVEGLGRFRWVWAGVLSQGIAIAVCSTLAVALDTFALVVIGVLLGLLVHHAVQVFLCISSAYLDGWRLAKGYLGAGVAAAIVAGISFLALNAIRTFGAMPWLSAVALLLAISACGAAWHWRWRIPPIAIARRYRLI